jgi:hypothetical protein
VVAAAFIRALSCNRFHGRRCHRDIKLFWRRRLSWRIDRADRRCGLRCTGAFLLKYSTVGVARILTATTAISQVAQTLLPPGCTAAARSRAHDAAVISGTVGPHRLIGNSQWLRNGQSRSGSCVLCGCKPYADGVSRRNSAATRRSACASAAVFFWSIA